MANWIADYAQSENRTNGEISPQLCDTVRLKCPILVALSRARLGLYILGNAPDFASQSPMWSSVISQLHDDGAIGDAIPIKCYRHPEDVRYISSPGELPKVSPDGGWLVSCAGAGIK